MCIRDRAKEEARNNIDMKRQKITLNEWFEEWFTNYKIPNIKETSVFPMRSKYYNTFGKEIGNMKVTDIRNLDICLLYTSDCSGFVSYCLTGAYSRLGTTYTFLTWTQVSLSLIHIFLGILSVVNTI